MQPLTAGPRATLTEAQVTEIIQDSAALTVSAGCELLDRTLAVREDITDDLAPGGSVARSSYATLHGSCKVGITRTLDWGNAIIRPYMTLDDGATSARFNLGAYYTSAPTVQFTEFPVTHDVTGFDILHGLNTPIGEVYAVDEAQSYLTTVETILIAQGVLSPAYVIDQTAAARVLPTARVWPLDERTTWLTVINDLLASIGYQGIWSDWDGKLRCGPYLSPLERTVEWVYDAGAATSMLTPDRSLERDYFQSPNRWVAVRNNNIDGVAPTEGDGVYTYTNQLRGPTSVEARGGRIITRFLSLDVADQTALIALAQQSIDADLRLKVTVATGTAPNPLHWHFDRLYVADPALGAPLDVLGTAWTLPLGGDDMQHEWTVI